MMLANLSSAAQVTSGGDISAEHVEAPELRALLENFVSSSDDLAYATLLNSEAKGISAGRIAPDAFLQRELERAYAAAREGRAYNGQALTVGSGKTARTVVLVSAPVMYAGRFLGMIGSVVDLQFLIRRLQEINLGGLTPYVVDSQGRLIAGATPDYATGQDMTNLEIVKNFVDQGGKAQFVAATFNVMSEELEQFVEDLKRAANENRELFMGSIQMLAGAVDEKDPYTRGHSDRVTGYSVMIARELGQPEEFLEIVRVSAQLHDVGKIGIEDRILKKPGALTSEEFDIMKTHTSKGAHILRPVAQLKDMIPGIELHHESLDGRGYPHGLKGDEIPLLPRIIAVADTFDALTTNRPYQEARDEQAALRIIHNISGKRLDPAAVAAITAIYQRGEIRVPRPVLPLPPVPQPTPEIAASAAAAGVETSRF